ncbi:EAL domain-containing response regulator [Photobacterium nomapromontoriensis]|uniref:EAL domain-containing response regulator n=1 Tax=Photobacterium nomapromontoriensis TaxID=2910237 RepID=UPI003D14218A
MHILLVEDHPFQQQVLTNQIKQANHSHHVISLASTGKEALTHMAAYKPDILICDLNMPEMDGITFLSHLAQQKYQGGIIISSAASPSVIRSVGKMCQNYQLELIGTLTKPTSFDNLHQLLDKAELYLASRFNQPIIPDINQVSLTAKDITAALAEKWFVPHFQPIVDLKTGQWVSCEALIRMQHPTFGHYTPESFIEQLSSQGQDADLAMLTIHYILTHAPLLQGRKVAVNITPQTLIADGFVDKIIALAQPFPTISQLISFEITESDALENTGLGLEAASRLGMYGFKLSIDDFGTGYSSLKQLELLPFESLKLDRGFIQALPDSMTAQAIVEASLLLATRLSLLTIAEGVENRQQWHLLEQMGCQWAQGFYISKPIPVHELALWHANWQQKVTHQHQNTCWQTD